MTPQICSQAWKYDMITQLMMPTLNPMIASKRKGMITLIQSA